MVRDKEDKLDGEILPSFFTKDMPFAKHLAVKARRLD